jgi:hypothetical protein
VTQLGEADRAERRHLQQLGGHHGGGARSVGVGNGVEMAVAVVPVEVVPGQVQGEDRQPQVVGPHRVRAPLARAAVEQLRERDEQAERHHDQPALADGLARETMVLRPGQRLDQHACHAEAQEDVDHPAERSHRAILDAAGIR